MNTKTTPAKKSASSWTDAEVATISAKYIKGQNSAEQIQALLPSKSVAAIRGKLVSLGIYEVAEATATGGKDKPAKKLAIVGTIETLLSMPSGSLASLDKASKQELTKLAEQLVLISERQAADRAELTAQYAATIPEGDELATSGM